MASIGNSSQDTTEDTDQSHVKRTKLEQTLATQLSQCPQCASDALTADRKPPDGQPTRVYSPHRTPPARTSQLSCAEWGAGDTGHTRDTIISCGDCGQVMRSTNTVEKWIRCDSKGCHQYYHISCVGINRKVYDLLLKTSADIQWRCYRCLCSQSQDNNKPMVHFK